MLYPWAISQGGYLNHSAQMHPKFLGRLSPGVSLYFLLYYISALPSSSLAVGISPPPGFFKSKVFIELATFSTSRTFCVKVLAVQYHSLDVMICHTT